MPMSYSLTNTSFSHNNRMKGEVVGSIPIGCVCNIPIKQRKKKKQTYLISVQLMSLINIIHFHSCNQCHLAY